MAYSSAPDVPQAAYVDIMAHGARESAPGRIPVIHYLSVDGEPIYLVLVSRGEPPRLTDRSRRWLSGHRIPVKDVDWIPPGEFDVLVTMGAVVRVLADGLAGRW